LHGRWKKEEAQAKRVVITQLVLTQNVSEKETRFDENGRMGIYREGRESSQKTEGEAIHRKKIIVARRP